MNKKTVEKSKETEKTPFFQEMDQSNRVQNAKTHSEGMPELGYEKSPALEKLLSGVKKDFVVEATAPVVEYRKKKPNETKTEKELREDANKQDRALSRQWRKLKALQTFFQAAQTKGVLSKRIREEYFTAKMKYLALEEAARLRKFQLGEFLEDSFTETRERQEALQKRLSVLMEMLPFTEGQQKEDTLQMLDSVQDSIRHCTEKLKTGQTLTAQTSGLGAGYDQMDQGRVEARRRKERYAVARKQMAENRERVIRAYHDKKAAFTKILEEDMVYALKKDDGAGALNNGDLTVLEQCLHGMLDKDVQEDELENLAGVIAARCRKNIELLNRPMFHPDYIMQHLNEMDEMIRCANAFRFVRKICEERNVEIPELNQFQQNMARVAIMAEYVEQVFAGNGFSSDYNANSEEEQVRAAAQSQSMLEHTLQNWDALQPAAQEEWEQAENRAVKAKARKRTRKTAVQMSEEPKWE